MSVQLALEKWTLSTALAALPPIGIPSGACELCHDPPSAEELAAASDAYGSKAAVHKSPCVSRPSSRMNKCLQLYIIALLCM